MPEPGPGEVLIKVSAAGINRPDVFQRRAPIRRARRTCPAWKWPVKSCPATRLPAAAIGDKVCALVAGGGYAEYCVAPAAQCLPIPRGLSDIEAAGLPETYFTVWSNVFDRGGLAEGEALLVHGGASGIGTTAIQLARAMGNPVYATVGSDERARAVEALGRARHQLQDPGLREGSVGRHRRTRRGRGPGHGGGRLHRPRHPVPPTTAASSSSRSWAAPCQCGHGAGHASPAHHHRFHAASAPRGLQGRHCPRCASARRCWSRAPSSRSSTPPSRWPRPPRPTP